MKDSIVCVVVDGGVEAKIGLTKRKRRRDELRPEDTCEPGGQ
jgi:hypothetical protein